MELGNAIGGHSRGTYPIDREPFEERFGESFRKLLDAVNCDSYGVYIGGNEAHITKIGGFTCNLFEINPYYWGECDCGAKWRDEHTEDCAIALPNFRYKNENHDDFVEIRWYKYPFRDSYSNVNLNENGMFEKILEHCLEYAKTLEA